MTFTCDHRPESTKCIETISEHISDEARESDHRPESTKCIETLVGFWKFGTGL